MTPNPNEQLLFLSFFCFTASTMVPCGPECWPAPFTTVATVSIAILLGKKIKFIELSEQVLNSMVLPACFLFSAYVVANKRAG